MMIWGWFDDDLRMIWFDLVASTVKKLLITFSYTYTNTYFYHMNIICIHIYPVNNERCSILCSLCRWNLFKPSDCVKGGIWGRNPNTWNLYSPPIHTRVGLVNGGNTSIRELGNIFPSRGNIYDTFLVSNPLRTDGKGCAEWFSWNLGNYFMIPCTGI